MRKLASSALLITGLSLVVGGAFFACGGSDGLSEFDSGASSKGGKGGDGSSGSGLGDDDDGGKGLPTSNDATTSSCVGLQCAIATNCTGPDAGAGTTITGKVLDPAGANPIYNALVYVPLYDPANPAAIPEGEGIQPITGGVSFPSGVSCDSCSYLYTGTPIAIGTTQPDGTFIIPNAPSGTNVPLVVQIGKWRTHTTVSTVTACGTASAGNIKLPASADGTDPIISMPQFAISMGNSDSLECLLYRIGIDLSEFSPGASKTGHVHLFTGDGMALKGGGTGAPAGDATLWSSLSAMENYDVSLFSCEGKETTNANPQILEQYVNAGGRAFTSHYHYSWLTGPIDTANGEGPEGTKYTANADWSTPQQGGGRLATWDTDDTGVNQAPYFGATVTDLIGVKISTTLNTGGKFPKGIALTSWLQSTGAFGTNGVPADEVAIQAPAFDPDVVPTANPLAQPWASYDTATYQSAGTTGDPTKPTAFPTAYFSFNTPIDAVSTDGGAAPYCGRVVFSGLHVGAAAQDTTTDPRYNTYSLPSTGTCKPLPGDLSPQEKILEFMLFDLSSCVVPDTSTPVPPITVVR